MENSLLRLRHTLTPADAADLWVKADGLGNDEYNQIYTAIINALKSGELSSEVDLPKVRGSGNPYLGEAVYKPNYDMAEISLEKLKKWAKDKGLQPKFLFPALTSSTKKPISTEIERLNKLLKPANTKAMKLMFEMYVDNLQEWENRENKARSLWEKFKEEAQKQLWYTKEVTDGFEYDDGERGRTCKFNHFETILSEWRKKSAGR